MDTVQGMRWDGRVETVQVDGGRCIVQTIEGDGNCMFGAIAHQLFGFDVRSLDHSTHTRALRQMVVEHISVNADDERLAELVRLRMEREFRLLHSADSRQSMRNFLTVLSQNGIWGASESLLAIAMLFECEVFVYRERGFRTIVTNTLVSPTNRISLIYRGTAGRWNHYDSIIEFVEDDIVAPTAVPSIPHWWSLVDSARGKCFALHTRPDGNCMFSALVHQLFGYDMDSSPHQEATELLRKQAVNLLRTKKNERAYNVLLTERVKATSNRIALRQHEDAITNFLNQLALPGTWGGTESLTALSEIYDVDIHTIWVGGPVTQINRTNVPTRQCARLVYNATTKHYDSFLCYEDGLTTTYTHSPCADVIDISDNEGEVAIDTSCINTASGKVQTNAIINSHSNVNHSGLTQDSGSNSTILSKHCPMSATIGASLTTVKSTWPTLNVGTWNVRGANERTKRVTIDKYLAMVGLHIVAIQETKMIARTCDSQHYKWILGTGGDAQCTSRRLAFLVHVSMIHLIRKVHCVTDNILAIEVSDKGVGILLVNVHLPQTTDTDDFEALCDFIMQRQDDDTVILGDFNAHLGHSDLTSDDRLFIGPQLRHAYCNDNGEALKRLLHLAHFTAKNTWCKSPSVLTTWKNKRTSSQIDHLLCNAPLVRFSKIYATWVHSVSTDHALLTATIRLPNERVTSLKRKSPFADTEFPASKRSRESSSLNWEVMLLQDTKHNQCYTNALNVGATAMLASINEERSANVPDTIPLWTRISTLITRIANSTLKPIPRVPTPAQQHARNEYRNARNILSRRPHNESLRSRVKLTKERLEQLRLAQVEEECKNFFHGITTTHPRKRLSSTYKFLKQYRQKKTKSRGKHIPIQHWEDELRKTFAGVPPASILEDDFVPLGPPPDSTEICEIIQRLRNGTCPGQDSIQAELLKTGVNELAELLRLLFEEVWITNDVPDEWLRTVQVPIPKIPNPESVDDFRRLAMTTSIYKVYASLLLSRLEVYTGELPLYQAGFIRNRSVDDHIFTLRRICEERWRKGLPTVILSIDLKKAFDMVDTGQLTVVLLEYGVPKYLINRVIAAILRERTYIRWGGRRTTGFDRTRGVKQGCPISPYLFVIVMHRAMRRVAERLNIDLDLSHFNMPLILAYADDLIVMGDSVQSLEGVLAELELELGHIGLTVNERKCSVLLRDPLHCHPPLDEYVTINGKRIRTAQVMKYLGIYLSSDLDRRGTVNNRIQSAYKVFYSLLPFLKAYRLPWPMLCTIYHTVIATHALYGLKVATLTKRSRQSLRKMERNIVTRLRDLARDRVTESNIHGLLSGRTIIRKVRVHRMRYWGHVARRPAKHVLRRALIYKITGKLKAGRPCFTWNSSLARDLQRTRDRDWETTISDAGAHNAKCEDIFNDSDTDVSDL